MRYDRGLYFKSAPEIAERFPGRPDVLDNTLAIADQVDVAFEKKYHVPSFPLPAGVAIGERAARDAGRRRAPGSGTATRCPTTVQRAARLRARRDHEDGLRRLLPDRRRLHQGGARPRHPGGSGPRLGGGLARGVRAPHHRRLPAQVRPAVRALPESGARVDARHRRRLLLRAARRGDRVRAPEVRARIGGPDRDVRHAEVARRDQGRGPRARLHARRDRRAGQARSPTSRTSRSR